MICQNLEGQQERARSSSNKSIKKKKKPNVKSYSQVITPNCKYSWLSAWHESNDYH